MNEHSPPHGRSTDPVIGPAIGPSTSPSTSPSTGQSVCHVINADAASDWLIVCEHASAHIPSSMQSSVSRRTTAIATSHGIQVPPRSRDCSAIGSARRSCCIATHDCSSTAIDPSSIRTQSGKSARADRCPAIRASRHPRGRHGAERYYHPFHERVSELLDTREASGRRTRLGHDPQFQPGLSRCDPACRTGHHRSRHGDTGAVPVRHPSWQAASRGLERTLLGVR